MGEAQITLPLLSTSSINCTPPELDVCMIPFNIILLFNSVSIVIGLLDSDCAVDIRFHLRIKQLSTFLLSNLCFWDQQNLSGGREQLF